MDEVESVGDGSLPTGLEFDREGVSEADMAKQGLMREKFLDSTLVFIRAPGFRLFKSASDLTTVPSSFRGCRYTSLKEVACLHRRVPCECRGTGKRWDTRTYRPASQWDSRFRIFLRARSVAPAVVGSASSGNAHYQ